MKALWVIYVFICVSILGIDGNWFKEHARLMFEQHGRNATLIYEHPETVRDFSFLPALINEEAVVMATLLLAEQTDKPTIFNPPGFLNGLRHRMIQVSKTTPGKCFCCYFPEGYRKGWKNIPEKEKEILLNVGNYSHCTEKFYLYGKHNVSQASGYWHSLRFQEQYSDPAQGEDEYYRKAREQYEAMKDSSFGLFSQFMDQYEALDQFLLNLRNLMQRKSMRVQDDILSCNDWKIYDPDLWFFYDGWASNFHPGGYQCAGIGYFTFPVQVASRRIRTKRDRSAPLGPACSDEVIIGPQLSGTEGGRVAGGLLTGLLTLGSYPGIVAQENRKSILGLTCRLEKSINATGIIVRSIQSEVEDLHQIVLQHRMALDYLLARQGGFCKLMKEGCKVRFHDLNKTIEDELNQMTDLIEHNTKGISSPFDWITSWLPSIQWIKELFFAFCIIILVVLLMLCIVPIIFKMTRKCIHEMISEKQDEIQLLTLVK